jgi:hypothetical protein
MDGVLARQVWDALNDPSPIESAERTKDLVAQSFREADASSIVTKTTYFNNSYLPDLMIEWPGGRTEARSVFLRPTQDPGWLQDDIETTGNAHATFVSLDDLLDRDRQGEERTQLDASARQSRTFVTEVSSLERLSDARSTAGAGAGLLAAAAVRGGLGVMDSAQANDLTEAVDRGFAGARQTDREATREGVQALTSYLQNDQADRLNGVLQAVWTASGGSAEAFPSDAPDLSSTIDVDALSFLLQFESSEDPSFWRRISRASNLELVVAAAADDATWPGLQRLMSVTVPRLTTKACVVRSDSSYVSLLDDVPLAWQVRDGALVLRGGGISAWLAHRLADIGVPDAESDGLAIADFLVRAQRGAVVINQLQASNGDRAVTYGSESNSDVTGDDEMRVLSTALGDSISVRRAAARVREKHHVDLNFERLSASGRATARISLGELAWTSINMLAPTTPALRRELERVLRLAEEESTDSLIEDMDEDNDDTDRNIDAEIEATLDESDPDEDRRY